MRSFSSETVTHPLVVPDETSEREVSCSAELIFQLPPRDGIAKQGLLRNT
jgi:hypothetical protein